MTKTALAIDDGDDPRDKKAELDAERAINEQYIRRMEQLIKSEPNIIKSVSVSQSANWTGTAPKGTLPRNVVSPIVGRVVLDPNHPELGVLGDNLYIVGYRPGMPDELGVEFINWAAPIAVLFFQGREASDGLASFVHGRRTFVARHHDIIDFDDEVESDVTEYPFTRGATDLVIAMPPSALTMEDAVREPAGASAIEFQVGEVVEDDELEDEGELELGEEFEDDDGFELEAEFELEDELEALLAEDEVELEVEAEAEAEAEAEEASLAPEAAPAEVAAEDGEAGEAHGELADRVAALGLELQHVDAVFTVMAQPKEGHLGRILGTMQRDQARLFTWPANVPLIVQGKPGTGKTVSAVYRALWWAHSERESDRVARMGIIGPNELWLAHVNHELSSELQGRDADIRPYALPDLLRNIVGLRNSPSPTLDGAVEASSAFGRSIDHFVASLNTKPETKKTDQRVRAVLDLARNADAASMPDRGHREFFATLPAWDKVLAKSQYLPMLASFALALGARVPGGPVGHLIVDEAQNVTPLEWKLLKDYVLEPGGGLSLFGDMNQRRSDHTAATWESLAADLKLTDEDGRVEIHVLEIGFRSTKQIAKFANQLLPAGQRSHMALRSGPPPAIVRTSSDPARRAECFKQVEALSAKYDGHVAWITTDRLAADRFFRESADWAHRPVKFTWECHDRMAVVLDANDASGLEYDAVVVEEPAVFEQNFGRDGVLYTSLTRANKELVIVHTKPLPGKLRPLK